jgi:hypothetical protein
MSSQSQQESNTAMCDLFIENYSPYSFAVFGTTLPYKNELKEAEGKFNENLKGRPGWIFKNSKRKEIEGLIEKLRSEPVRANIRKSEKETDEHKLISSLISRIEVLETELSFIKKHILSSQSSSSSSSSSSIICSQQKILPKKQVIRKEEEEYSSNEDEEKPPQRFLRR